MFSVNVAIGNVSWALVYNDEESAKTAFDKLDRALYVTDMECIVKIDDDYGQTLLTKLSNVAAVMLEDWNKTKLGHVERALHLQRTQAEAQKRWERDPAAQTRTLGLAGGQMPFVPLQRN